MNSPKSPVIGSGAIRLAFALTIFLSAFLLFLVQPLISKIILPWFGGSTGVWATCMVFFQAMLCLGYGYAHFVQKLSPKAQRWCHWTLLGLACLCLPVMPGEAWKPVDGNYPSWRILTILFLKTGLPYLALSATGPLLQSWHVRLFPESRVYRLYALSNVASLTSLLLFPLWFERTLTSNSLSNVWSILFFCFVAGCGFVAYLASQVHRTQPTTTVGDSPVQAVGRSVAPWPIDYVLWLVLPAFASFLLVGATSHLCQDIASTPFLWILPLCLYLLSFILCFDAPRWYVRRVYVVLGLIGLYGVIAMRDLGDSDTLKEGWLINGTLPLSAPILHAFNWYEPSTTATVTWAEWFRHQVERGNFHFDLIGQIVTHCLALFSIFMICHGELVKRKPAPSYLTVFYLTLSIGSAIGSGFVSLVAPSIFDSIWEWWFGLIVSVGLLCLLLFEYWPNRTADFSFAKTYFFFVLPSLVVLAVTVFQNSTLPLELAKKFSTTTASLVSSQTSPSDATDVTDPLADLTALNPPSGFDLASAIPKSMAVTLLLMIFVMAVLAGSSWLRGKAASRWMAWAVVNFTTIGLVAFYLRDSLQFSIPNVLEKPSAITELTNLDNVVWRDRNFYGALSIEEDDDRFLLQHGRITHGTQYLDNPRRSAPTTYYSENSGVALAIDHVANRSNVHIGAVGLGTGTLASFAVPTWKGSDGGPTNSRYRMTIYEINPLVVDLSEKDRPKLSDPWFVYVKDARKRGAQVDIVLGDARLMMERQETQGFDVLAVDAFSGDSIPTHLLTDEAMKIYMRHLKADGVLAIHISNRYLDLEPVCKALATKYNYRVRVVEDDTESDGYSSTWVLLSLDESLIGVLDEQREQARPISPKNGILWTDAFTSLYEVLINDDYDDAVETIAASTWFQSVVAQDASSEIFFRPKLWRDGWTYCQAQGEKSNFEVRVRDNRLEVKKEDGSWDKPS
jgi:spermidine synthase